MQSSTSAMDARLQSNNIVLRNVPASCTDLRFFLNGVQCHRCLHTAGTLGASVPLTAFDDAVRNSLPSNTPLLQCYALDAQGTVLALAAMSQLPVPIARDATPPHIADNGRLVASALHGPGDVHRWQFPVERHLEADGDGTSLICVRVLFDVDNAVCANSASQDPLVTVEWEASRINDEAPQGRPPGSAWGQLRASTTVDVSCRESIFCAPVSRDGSVRCTITVTPRVQIAPGLIRYAVYIRAAPDYRPPLLLGGEQSAAAVLGKGCPASPRNAHEPIGKRLAVLVGVSKYTRRPVKRMSDLEYADDDAVLWYRYLNSLGFDCKVLGDEFSPYPRFDGPGTVQNVRAAVRAMVTQAHSPADRLVFVTSSHGAGDGRGHSHLCLLPDPLVGTTPGERAGQYMDHEIAADLSGGGMNRARNFVFLDACFSGGIIEEVLEALPNVVGSTTCTRKGYGYDSQATCSGAWTNGFLMEGLVARAQKDMYTDLAALYIQARDTYVAQYPNHGDRPCFFGRAPGCAPCNTEESLRASEEPKKGVFLVREWLG